MAELFERRGSRDFDRGAGGGTGQLLYAVVGAASQDEALALAEADAPLILNGYIRGSGRVTEMGPTLDFVDFDYERGIPSDAGPIPGNTPAESRPAPAGQDNNSPLPRDVTVSVGGGTTRAMYAKETRHSLAKSGDTAPDFGGLVGVKHEKGGKFTVEGVEVVAGGSEFSITKRFRQITIGWFRHCLDLVATVNSEPFLGTDEQECLFLGADLNYKDEEATPAPGQPGYPWTATGKWRYSRNRVSGELDDDGQDPLVLGDITIPSVMGHDYVEVHYRPEEETITYNGVSLTVVVERPRWVYVHRVYPTADHNSLGFN